MGTGQQSVRWRQEEVEEGRQTVFSVIIIVSYVR